MATTYNPTLTTALDRARLALADTGALTDEGGSPIWFYQDETLLQLIDLNGYNEGVAQAADALRMRFAQEPEVYVEENTGARVELKLRIQALKDLAAQLRTTPPTPPATIEGSQYAVGLLRHPSTEGNFL